MNKDWTGNSNSVWKTLGASNHTNEEREPNEFYATSPQAIDYLLKKVELPKQILEPACGAGHLSIRLEELGYKVKSYDIIDRGFGETQDFFKMTEPPFDGDFAIVTNPPFKYAKDFVLHSLELVPDSGLVCMFLKTTFAEGKQRYNEVFSITPPSKSCNSWSASYVPKTGISTTCGRMAGVRLRIVGGFGKKAIKDKQHWIG